VALGISYGRVAPREWRIVAPDAANVVTCVDMPLPWRCRPLP
jgi:hypothetical protein